MNFLKLCLIPLSAVSLFYWTNNDPFAQTKKDDADEKSKSPIKFSKLIALQIEYSLVIGPPYKIKRELLYWPVEGNLNLQRTGAELSAGFRMDSPFEVVPLYFQIGVSNLYYGRPVQKKYSRKRDYLFWYRRMGLVKNLGIGTFDIGINYLKNFKAKDSFSALLGSLTYMKRIKNSGINATLGYSRQKMKLNLTSDIFDPCLLHPIEIILPFKEGRLYLSVQVFKTIGPITPFVEVVGSKLLSSGVGIKPPNFVKFVIIGVQIQTRQDEQTSSRVHLLTYPKRIYPYIEVH